MTYVLEKRAGPKTTPLPYRCSFENFWLGLKDYVLERVTGPNASQGSAAVTRSAASSVTLLSVAAVLMVVLAFALAQFAPVWIGSAYSPSTRQVAEFSVVASTLVAVAVMLAVPAVVGWRFWRFSRAMCVRGWEIRCGTRQACRLG